jgi:hypothetical protein
MYTPENLLTVLGVIYGGTEQTPEKINQANKFFFFFHLPLLPFPFTFSTSSPKVGLQHTERANSPGRSLTAFSTLKALRIFVFILNFPLFSSVRMRCSSARSLFVISFARTCRPFPVLHDSNSSNPSSISARSTTFLPPLHYPFSLLPLQFPFL